MLRFLKDFLIYGFASILSKIVAVFLMPVYTNILTREEYGTMALLLSISGIIDLVSNFNIHSGIARDYYEKGVDRKKLVSTGLWSILSLSLSIMAILIITRRFWLDNVLELSGFDTCFIIFLMGIPTGSLTSYFSILTRFKRKPVLFSAGILLQLIIQVSVSIYTIVFLRTGIIGFFIAIVLANIFSLIYFSYINRAYIGFAYKTLYIKRALIFAIPTMPAILAGWLDTSLGQILVGRNVSLTDLGVYSIALQMASVFSLISVALNNVWSPFLYENYKKEEFVDEVQRIFLTFVLLLSSVACSLSLLSPEIVLLLSNPSYIEAAGYFTILCIPMGIYALFPFATSGVSISRDTKYIGISYVIGSIFNLAFIFTFLPRWSVIAVPIGLLLSRIITYSILYYVTKKKGFLVLPNKYIILYVFLIAGCFCINYIDANVIYRILLVVLINALLLRTLVKKLDVMSLIQKFTAKKN